MNVAHLQAISPRGLICHINTVQTQEHVQSANTTINADDQQSYANRQPEKHAKDTAARQVAPPQGDICDQHKEMHDGSSLIYQVVVVVANCLYTCLERIYCA